jgi:hypothetical protein
MIQSRPMARRPAFLGPSSINSSALSLYSGGTPSFSGTPATISPARPSVWFPVAPRQIGAWRGPLHPQEPPQHSHGLAHGQQPLAPVDAHVPSQQVPLGPDPTVDAIGGQVIWGEEGCCEETDVACPTIDDARPSFRREVVAACTAMGTTVSRTRPDSACQTASNPSPPPADRT